VKVTGHYHQCVYCKVPWAHPLPKGWTVTVAGMYGLAPWITPHEPQCPNGFQPRFVVPDVEEPS